MNIVLYGIKNCDTMKKAREWLDKRAINYRFHDFKSEGVERHKLAIWCKACGWETLLNRSGTTFRKLPQTDRTELTESKAIALMHAQPTLIKRPVLEIRDAVLVGFKPDLYAAQRGLS